MTCSCYSTKTHINSVILILKLNLTSLRNIYIKGAFVEHHTHFYVYVSQRSQIQFKDEDHIVNISFRWVTTTLFSLRITTSDALIVPSDICQDKLPLQTVALAVNTTNLQVWFFDPKYIKSNNILENVFEKFDYNFQTHLKLLQGKISLTLNGEWPFDSFSE